MRKRSVQLVRVMVGAALLALAPFAHASERILLKSGFPIDCVRHEVMGNTVRLFMLPSMPGADLAYTDVPASSIVSVEIVADPVLPRGEPVITLLAHTPGSAEPTPAELQEMLAHAGAAHHIDADLLAAVVHAESNGHAHAVSHAGARGLMQLMPGTAAELGVADAFMAADNIEGGTKYLDALLTRYNDNLAKALAAYNAGPGAVDRYRGVPPYRETRAYVSRIIREFNRRKAAAPTVALAASATLLSQAH